MTCVPANSTRTHPRCHLGYAKASKWFTVRIRPPTAPKGLACAVLGAGRVWWRAAGGQMDSAPYILDTL
eukprot:12140684-Alexandrium_andersonii.AAC.1